MTVTRQGKSRVPGGGNNLPEDTAPAEHPARAFIEATISRGSLDIDGQQIKPARDIKDHGGRPGCVIDGHMYLYTRIIEQVSAGVRYAEAVRILPDGSGIEIRADGKARRFAIKLATSSKTKPAVIRDGRVIVTGRFRAHEPAPDRRLVPAEPSDYATIESENRAGKVWDATLTGMQFLKGLTQNPEWVDRLGLTDEIRLSDIKNYIRTQFGDHDGLLMIQGQGPVYLPDGTLIFAARSVVFGIDGSIRDIRTDLTDIPKAFDYYDVTSPADIKPDDITAGCKEFMAAYDECPAHPEIPAAFMGQLFTGPVAATHIQYFSALYLSGEHGSGKTLYAARYDSVQSRTLRGSLRAVRPALNMGDSTGTLKGPKYRVKYLGGFSITADDVIRAGMTELEIKARAQDVSNLTRSREAGGAAIARIDRARDRVTASQAPELHSSIKFTAEKQIYGVSTQSRLIILPHLTASWGYGGIFDTEISKRLSKPESRELQHLAWSAFVYWLFQHIDTDLADCYTEAENEIRTWDVPARTVERYAAVLAGNYAFKRFCAGHDLDISEPVSRAVLALRECAKRQARLSVPLALRFREAVTSLRTAGKASFPGPPIPDPDGIVNASYSAPWRARTVKHRDGTEERKRDMPAGIDLRDLGLHVERGNPTPKGIVLGYVIPPRSGSGGPKGSDITRRWLIAMKPDQFKELCRQASRDGQLFTPDDVMRSLRQEQVGDVTRVYVAKHREWAHVIDLTWLCTDGEDSSE